MYRRSKHPVALLGRPIMLLQDVRLLAKVLRGKLVLQSADSVRLSNKTSLDEARQAFTLLDPIATDGWWTRAWAFQENYLAGQRMILLISHPLYLKDIEDSAIFGSVPRELGIHSTRHIYA